MKVCREFRERLFEFLSGDVGNGKYRGYLSHWQDCPLCLEEFQAARKIWNSLDRCQEIDVPEDLREKTLALVYAEAQKEQAQAAYLAARWGRLSFSKVLGAVLAGVSLSLLFILMLGQKVETQPLTDEQLLALGTLWSGVLITGFCWIFGKFQIKGFKLHFAALFAILATFLVMVGTYLCPDATAYGWWKSTGLGTFVQNAMGDVGGCFVFGIFYVLPAALLIAPVLRNRFKGVYLNTILLMAAVFLLLLLPAIYIQCAYLAKGLMFSWIIGSFIGALGGILGGMGLWTLRQKMVST